MDNFFENAARTPGGVGDNRYVKTSQYQLVKVIRQIFYLLGLAVSAIVRLIVDVVKGITGRG